MASAAWPSVVSALKTVAEDAVSPCRVVRGRDVSHEPGDVVLIGIQTISDIEDVGNMASAGSFQQTMQTFGGNREEVGTVNGLVVAYNGDGDQEAAFLAAFDHLADIEAALRADKTLGLTTFDYVVAELQTGEVSESQDDQGATCGLSFTVIYKIRI